MFRGLWSWRSCSEFLRIPFISGMEGEIRHEGTLFSMPLLRLWLARHVCCIISGMTDTTRDSRRELRKSLNLEWPCCCEFLTHSSPCCSFDKKIPQKNTLLHRIFGKKLQVTQTLDSWLGPSGFPRWYLAGLIFIPDWWQLDGWQQRNHTPLCLSFPVRSCVYPVLGVLRMFFSSLVRAGYCLTTNCMLEFH